MKEHTCRGCGRTFSTTDIVTKPKCPYGCKFIPETLFQFLYILAMKKGPQLSKPTKTFRDD
jgi:glutaredoxin